MNLIGLLTLIFLMILSLIPFLRNKGKAFAVYATISSIAIFSSIIATKVLWGETFSYSLPGDYLSGSIRIEMDALSAWFILIINYAFLTGGFYSIYYMKMYRQHAKRLSLQGILFLLLYVALLSLCVLQNSFAFIIAWELMALSAFMSILFEHENPVTVKAGINYFIQSHVSLVFIMIGFLWVANQTGSFDFNAIQQFSLTHPGEKSMLLYLLFLIGFAIKAGFVPFHTWLPHAHPAAPAPISGIMSGVLIKVGIYGILRMLLLIKVDFTTIGYILLTASLFSGIFGIMMAIIQRNLKTALAYSSIENIGIIGMGIAIGCIGLGSNNVIICTLGFAAALIHILNHSLFKSLLFFTAGNIYQATHDLDLEDLGGLIKKMPQTAFIFLIAALAISGLPPFNGFISEFILYTGIMHIIQQSNEITAFGMAFGILALVLIGGLAIFCFSKIFSIVFLGNSRKEFIHEVVEVNKWQLLPLYFSVALILGIGIFPSLIFKMVSKPVQLFAQTQHLTFLSFQNKELSTMQSVGNTSLYLILILATVWGIRKIILRKNSSNRAPVWTCAYIAPIPKSQYTASSFSRTYRKLFSPLFLLKKDEKKLVGIFPDGAHLKTQPIDKLEKWLIDRPIHGIKNFLNLFSFIQNGQIQYYVAYGILFIIITLLLSYLKIYSI
jgi:hydrogenase-4 component B